MTDQEILNNAPEGAEYIDGEGVYWRLHDKYTWGVENPRTGGFVRQMTAYPSNGSVRSLADIRRIVEFGEIANEAIDTVEDLTQRLKELIEAKKRIKELEQAIMSNCYDDPSTSGKRLMTLVTKRGEKL